MNTKGREIADGGIQQKAVKSNFGRSGFHDESIDYEVITCTS